jgi:ribokinase
MAGLCAAVAPGAGLAHQQIALRASLPKLVVVGNACLDVTYHLDRLPKQGETLIAREVVTDLGGKGFNQAVAASRAGIEVHLIAAIGNDATAGKIKAILREEGMEERGLIEGEGISDESLLLIDPEGENLIVSHTKRAQALTASHVESAMVRGDLLLLQGNLAQETTFHAMKLARAANMRIAVNPSPFQDWFRTMPQVDLIIANQGEADALGQMRAHIALVTLGQQGCRLRHGDAEVTIAAPKIRAVATSGAGDVFAGTFIAEWLATGDAEQAARLAVLAASDKTTRHGTLSAFPDRSAIDRFRGTMRVPS